MRFVELPSTPVVPGRSPARIAYREKGEGPPVLILHGGWGYEAYPFDAAIDALAPRHRVIAPDRSGYGRSGPWAPLARGFHRAMAEETLAVMDALGVREASLWGHSDGSVVAGWIAFLAPERVRAVVFEAIHFFAHKPGSLPFFETAVEDPARFGAPAAEACERDHGPEWREVLRAGGRAWLDIIGQGARGLPDVYAGRLGEVRAPALLLHGTRDPRTEPGEVEAALAALPRARALWVDAAHAPHTSRSAPQALAAAVAFLGGAEWPPPRPIR